jgi:hypothetical protein
MAIIAFHDRMGTGRCRRAVASSGRGGYSPPRLQRTASHSPTLAHALQVAMASLQGPRRNCLPSPPQTLLRQHRFCSQRPTFSSLHPATWVIAPSCPCRKRLALYHGNDAGANPQGSFSISNLMTRGDSSAGRALRSQRRGREFDSPSLHS